MEQKLTFKPSRSGATPNDGELVRRRDLATELLREGYSQNQTGKLLDGLPGEVWGSPAKVDAWIAKHRPRLRETSTGSTGS